MKFLNEHSDLKRIDIVLTDFGLVGQNSKGGTPIFASPECFENKTDAADVFSLGRVFLFMKLPKELFLKFLFVPITSSADTNYLTKTILNQDDLISLTYAMMKTRYDEDTYAMMKTQKPLRMQIQEIRSKFNSLKINSRINMNSFAQTEIERIVNQNLSPEMVNYISDLEHIS